jgi:hypothetical protein
MNKALKRALETAKGIGMPLQRAETWHPSDPFQGYAIKDVIRYGGRVVYEDTIQEIRDISEECSAQKLSKSDPTGAVVMMKRGKHKGRVGIVQMQKDFDAQRRLLVYGLDGSNDTWWMNPTSVTAYGSSPNESMAIESLLEKSRVAYERLASAFLECSNSMLKVRHTPNGDVGSLIGVGDKDCAVKTMPVIFEGEGEPRYVVAHEIELVN